MEKRSFCKFLFRCTLILLIELAVVCGIAFCCFHGGTGDTDKERAFRYEERDESAQESVGRIGSGLDGIEEKMLGTGRKIDSVRVEIDGSVSGLGELGEDADRITERSRNAEAVAGRIEDGICRIEQIIFKTEEENGVLADGCDCIDPGGNN